VDYVKLGRRGPVVSRFCLGLLPLSRLQSSLPRVEAAALLETALEAGVTFFDTAELYDTYPLVRDVLGPPAVVATKAYAYTYAGMRESPSTSSSCTSRSRASPWPVTPRPSAAWSRRARPGSWAPWAYRPTPRRWWPRPRR